VGDIRLQETNVARYLARSAKKWLPASLVQFLQPAYHNLFDREARLILDKKLLKEIMEYFNLRKNEVFQTGYLLETPNRLLWTAMNPKTDGEIRKFYEITPFYVFELAFWHMRSYEKKRRDKIVRVASGSVLDYGAGIGDLCAVLAEKGLDVTYADVYGQTFKFAEWMFRKRDLHVKTINLSRAELEVDYDTIICLDVVEHVLNPEIVLENLILHLKKNGKLILRFGSYDNLHPMHLNVELDLEEFLRSKGLAKTERWLWLKS
jgi:SAM-dependent methyltransferase